MRYYLSFLLMLGFLVLKAQPLFTLTPDTVFASKPASNFTLYNYAAFNNLSDDTLAMRWVKTQTFVQQQGGHGGQDFGNWTISIQDPINFYNPALTIDSADFTLLPTSSSTDKFILQLYPNGQAGILKMAFKVFAVNDPGNSIEILFDYLVTPSTTDVQEPTGGQDLELFPNPASGWLQLRNSSNEAMACRLYSSNGAQIQSLNLESSDFTILSISTLPPGHYYFLAQTTARINIASFVKN